MNIASTDIKFIPSTQFSLSKFGVFCRRNNCQLISKDLIKIGDPLLIIKELFSFFKIPIFYKMLCSESVARSILYHFYQSNVFTKDNFDDLAKTAIIKYNVNRNERAQKKKQHTTLDLTSEKIICHLPAAKFYSSREWRTIRYMALNHYGNTCMACGVSPKQGAIIHVDHIKPRSVFPELSLDFSNLQILCEDCNIGKSNKSKTDWR